MAGLRPHISAKINGTEVQFLADSGAFYSVISPGSAVRLGLTPKAQNDGIVMRGVNGEAAFGVATVKTFSLVGLDIPNVEFIVGGSRIDAGAVGVLGQNIWSLADVEYDLARGMIRLMAPHDCKGRALAYWAGDKPFSAMDISIADESGQHTSGAAFINGHKIRVMFDTGAARSVVHLRASSRTGIDVRGPEVIDAGFTGGFGSRRVHNWIAPVADFKVGDEQISRTRLRLGDFPTLDVDMLIGADFFLSHRVYVANSQHRLYFTYNGGRVFNLDTDIDDQGKSTVATDPTPHDQRPEK
jgi:predicted aspartyl protease